MVHSLFLPQSLPESQRHPIHPTDRGCSVRRAGACLVVRAGALWRHNVPLVSTLYSRDGLIPFRFPGNVTILNPDGGAVSITFTSVVLSSVVGLFGEFDSVAVMNAGGGLLRLLQGNMTSSTLPLTLSSGASSLAADCIH